MFLDSCFITCAGKKLSDSIESIKNQFFLFKFRTRKGQSASHLQWKLHCLKKF